MVANRRIVVVLLLALGLQLPASAGVLYKSVDSNGRVTFSDVPVAGAVMTQRIESSESAKPGVGNDNSPIYLALAEVSNEAVARANAQMDMAEHAYALARQQTVGSHDPLSLANPARSAERQRLEVYKREVLDARKALMRALQQRSVWSQRPVA
jgi:hypothetical protein